MKSEIRLDMMVRYNRFSIKVGIRLMTMTLMLTACSENEQTVGTDTALPMEFSVAYPAVTRAMDSGFANGDRIGIFVADYDGDVPKSLAGGTLRADNMPFTYDEAKGKWTGSQTLYWKNQNTAVDVVGYYPYTGTVDNPTVFSFSIDMRQDRAASETRLGGYEASDLLWAKSVKALPSDGTINLTFKHLMAGMTISLERGGGFDEKEWAKLQKRVMVNHAATSTTVNLETGNVVPTGQGDASVFTLPYGNGFRAVVIPKTYEAGSEILTISVGDQSYKLTKEDIVTLQSGKMHKFSIKVDKRQDAGDYVFTLVGESISTWMDDEEFHDGIVRQYLIINVETPGTFSEVLKNQGFDYSEVRSLKVTGRVNAEDLYFMGDMPTLQNLNMKEVIIDDANNDNDDCIPESAFRESLISHLVLPDRLRIIRWGAFVGVPIVGTLVFPEGLEEIEGCAFSSSYDDNAGGFRVDFPSTLKTIGEWAFGGNGTNSSVRGELRFPEGLEEIGDHAFWNGYHIYGTLELPESIMQIGENAFHHCQFTGDLVIPSGIKIIPAHCFVHCSFDGNLILNEGVTNIKEAAFTGCSFRGELALPSTVREVGFESFKGNNFSSVALPEKLQLLGGGAFMGCQYLSGEIKIPSSIVTVPARCFQDCSLITSVVLPKNMRTIEEDAFTNDMYIRTIVSENPEPPYLDSHAFNNVVKTQINVEVSKEGLQRYKNHRTWSEFTRLTEYRNFVCRPAHACALTTARRQTLVLNADGKWKVTHQPDWVTLSKKEGSLKSEIIATFSELPSGLSLRQDSIVFQLEGTEVETYCALSQYGYEYNEDQMVQLQKHSKGNGISVYFVGDGWDAESIASGAYMMLCRKDMEYFFGLPPYDRLRDYFDVYACVALSQETGVSTMNISRDTKFDTFFTAGQDGCCSGYPARLMPYEEEVFGYVNSLTGRQTGRWFQDGDMWKSLVVLIPNTTEYTGCTYYYEDGSTISICPPSDRTYPNDTRGIIQHEVGGHGFGKLADESIVYNKYVPQLVVDKEIKPYKYWGWYANISTTGLPANVPWADLIFDPRYSNYVDVFEGGYGYTRGVWRPEANSCMNYAIPYYNAISRLDITRRVFSLAGEWFDIERDFYSVDTDQWGSLEINGTRASRNIQEIQPIHSHNVPVMLKHGQCRQFFKKLKNKRYEINR